VRVPNKRFLLLDNNPDNPDNNNNNNKKKKEVSKFRAFIHSLLSGLLLGELLSGLLAAVFSHSFTAAAAAAAAAKAAEPLFQNDIGPFICCFIAFRPPKQRTRFIFTFTFKVSPRRPGQQPGQQQWKCAVTPFLVFAVVVGGGFLAFVCSSSSSSSSEAYSKMTLNRLFAVSLRFVLPNNAHVSFSLSLSKFRHDDPDNNNPDNNPDNNNESVQ